ncbi:MAG: hypothetical protein IKP86_11175 [Anaerolineaceae bacterium]|nr:hypothetical protein [Anaerolineaceae bacterium]
MDWKKKTILIYALGGLIIGIGAGILTINNAVQNNREADLSLKNAGKVTVAALNAMQKIVLK